ncbi:MAG TPA: nickel-dependent lactate racemase [Polyangia bacterium]|nr:nickel-dependent lactate racemase [Polyangia bacterium]
MKTIHLLYGKDGMELEVPESADVLVGQEIPAVADADEAVAAALAGPIDSAPLAELVAAKKPRTVAITISDITRPVPNKEFLPAMLKALNACGIADSRIAIIIGTGMHRPSTPAEREILVGADIERRIEVIDHRADAPETLVTVSEDPPVSVCRRFAEADLRIVTGYIEAHFMAGFSGGRKGVCPALVDLSTVQRFHGFETLANPRADTGVLEGNPCHEIALKVARAVGVDFLFNVAITGDRRIAGIYCGDLEAAHLAGCKQVAEWTTAEIDGPYDLVITNGGGFPLDQTFYQTVKGMCTALPALEAGSTLLLVSHCGEKLGSENFTQLLMRWDNDWRAFLAHIEAHKDRTELDQWELQMQSRVLALIGPEKLWFVSDGISGRVQMHIAVNPVLGGGNARQRAQRAVDEYLAAHDGARIAVIPDGPYTMLRARES